MGPKDMADNKPKTVSWQMLTLSMAMALLTSTCVAIMISVVMSPYLSCKGLTGNRDKCKSMCVWWVWGWQT